MIRVVYFSVSYEMNQCGHVTSSLAAGARNTWYLGTKRTEWHRVT